ncbi:MAG: S24/S26 family peptidase [Bacteroidales bacterium]|nr:S24/S26 family peptidase [Bacteroidales bacterium]
MKMTLPNEILLAEVNRMLQEGHPVIIMAKGNSMLPFIRGGKDNVELVRNSNPAVGDLALCEIAPGHYVLHRIIRIKDGTITMKGDGNLRGTEQCRLENLCGTVADIIRPSGRRISVNTARFRRRSRLWAKMPYIIRRYSLAVYRRIA